MEEITLSGKSDIKERLEILSDLFKNAQEKVHHITDIRQRNMNYSLLIFAGLFSIGIKLNDITAQLILSITLTLIMLIFCLWDRQLHKYSHGWQKSSYTFYKKQIKIINNHENDVKFYRYDRKGEKTAQLKSFQPIVYYLLVVGALLSILIFRYLLPK